MFYAGLLVFNVIFLGGVCCLFYHLYRKSLNIVHQASDLRAFSILKRMVDNARSDDDVDTKLEIETSLMKAAETLVNIRDIEAIKNEAKNVFSIQSKIKKGVKVA